MGKTWARWVCRASGTSGEMVRDGEALESELRGGMGKGRHRLAVGTEAGYCPVPGDTVSGLVGLSLHTG